MDNNWESEQVKKARANCKRIKITINTIKSKLHERRGLGLAEDKRVLCELEENLHRWALALPEDERGNY